MSYKIVAGHRRDAVPALDEWCRRVGDSALGKDRECWIPETTWATARNDSLDVPVIPELDESREELRRVAQAERFCREAQFRLGEAQRQRREAVLEATRHRQHSRRRLSEVTGLSFARIQQLVGGAARPAR